MKNSNDTIGNRTRDSRACSAVRLWGSSYIIDTFATPNLTTAYVRLPSRPGAGKYGIVCEVQPVQTGGLPGSDLPELRSRPEDSL
jgi:hypothetical protein